MYFGESQNDSMALKFTCAWFAPSCRPTSPPSSGLQPSAYSRLAFTPPVNVKCMTSLSPPVASAVLSIRCHLTGGLLLLLFSL